MALTVTEMVQSVSPLLITVLLSFALTGLATWYARSRGLLDLPGHRHSHTQATPRGGGAGLILAIVIMSYAQADGEASHFFLRCLLPGMLILAVVGWWDDHRSLSAKFRFLIQLLVSFYLLWCTGVFLQSQGIAWMVIAGLSMVWMTNLYNFMDGSNGMAGMQGVFAGAVLAWLFHLSGDHAAFSFALIAAAACAGFLPWNLGRARVFMGDVGSGALGFLYAALLVYGTAAQAFSLPVAVLVMLVFLTDSTLTLLLRVMRGERWYTAHKQHLYQRLIHLGWTHANVLLFYQAVNLALVMPAIIVAVNFPALAWTVTLVTFMFSVGCWILVSKRIGVFA